MTTAVETGRHIEINGAALYVEEHGSGEPLVLAHCGFGSIEALRATLPLLAPYARVFVFDTRGHRRSTNPESRLSYELVADDMAALIRTLGLERPFVGGWSDGGQFALELGVRHPGLARGLIIGGTSLELGTETARAPMRAFFHCDANDEVDLDAFSRDHASTLVPVIQQWHGDEDGVWQRVVRQSAAMMLAYAGPTETKVGEIRTPAMVLVGDRDEHVPVEEAVRLYRALPSGELAILPATNHMRPIFDPAGFAAATLDFIRRH